MPEADAGPLLPAQGGTPTCQRLTRGYCFPPKEIPPRAKGRRSWAALCATPPEPRTSGAFTYV